MKSFIFIILFVGVFVNGIFTHPQPKVEERSQNIDRRESDSYNMALIAAAKDGQEDLVQLLIGISSRVSLNINAANQFGDTPLHAAAKAGHVKIVRLLIQNGANSNIRNNDGKSPKNLAIEQGYNEISKLLSVAHRACNLYTNLPTVRIIGGEPANFTWMAAVGYLSSNFKISFDCGATIISDLFVLTAAHCARDDRRPVTVRIGILSLTDDGGVTAEKHYIEKIIRHPDYSPTKKKNDIALIQLVKPIYFSNTVSPACLHTDLEDADPSVMLTVSGWGRISNQVRDRSDILLKANVQTVSLSQCNTTIWEYNRDKDLAAYRNGISESQYCARDPNGGSDSCEGDSGGPLQIIQGNNLPTVVGIVSFGTICGTEFPSIYTRVASYVDWIESYVWPNDEISPPLVSLVVPGQQRDHRQQQFQNDRLAFGYTGNEDEDQYKKNAHSKNPANIPSRCKPGEQLYPGNQGDDWVCDCKPGYIYYPTMKQCYPVYTRGPCRVGEIIVLPPNTVIPICTANPCGQGNRLPFRGGCYELSTRGPCIDVGPSLNVVGVNETTFELICTKDMLAIAYQKPK